MFACGFLLPSTNTNQVHYDELTALGLLAGSFHSKVMFSNVAVVNTT